MQIFGHELWGRRLPRMAQGYFKSPACSQTNSKFYNSLTVAVEQELLSSLREAASSHRGSSRGQTLGYLRGFTGLYLCAQKRSGDQGRHPDTSITTSLCLNYLFQVKVPSHKTILILIILYSCLNTTVLDSLLPSFSFLSPNYSI